MTISKFGWALWAMLPVGALAFHYGPGQAVYQQDVAVSLQRAAMDLEANAKAQHARAYELHLASIGARRDAFVNDTARTQAAVKAAGEAEAAAFAAASAAWKRVAEAYGHIQERATACTPQTLRQVRWARSKALVRSGQIWEGIDELESVLTEAEEAGGSACETALAARQELATAHYYGARLRRLSGEAEEDWLVDSGKARQHFRYLAEHARATGRPAEVVESHERDVELVLNLEQSALYELEGKPMPKDSPCQCTGKNPGKNKGKSKRPPQNKDARGAGGAEEIWQGW